MRIRFIRGVAVMAVVWLGSLAETSAQDQTPAIEKGAHSQVSNFERRCASCHDNPVNNPAPNRDALRRLSAERVLESLTTGSMAKHVTKEMTYGDIRAMAELTSGKPFNGAPPRDAASMKNRCGTPLVLSMNGPRWNGWSPDQSQTRFQTAAASGLQAEQVPQLKVKWAFAMPGAGSGGWSQPTVVGGAVFLGSDNRFVYALDAKSGCVYWSFEAMSGVRTAVNIAELRNVPAARHAALFGDYLGNIYGVNAETGQHLWTVKADEHPGAKITGSPVLDATGARLFVPVSSWEEIPGGTLIYNCCTFQGSIVALDVRTGKQIWKTYTMPERPKPMRKNSGDVQLFGPAGAAVWNTPTLDTKRGLLYAGTSNGYIGGPDGDTTDAIVAFDIATGGKKWWKQVLHNDTNCGGGGSTDAERRVNCPGFVRNPNDDVSASPILYTLPTGRTALLVPQESGRITAIDPDNNGASLWVSQAGDRLANGSIFGGAFDGELFYRALGFQDGTGAMAAIRPADGERIWYTTLDKPASCGDASVAVCSGRQTGGSTVMRGVVFTGARDGVLRGYSTRDGKIIWEFPTNRAFETVNGVPGHGGSFSGPGGPTIAGGMLFTGSGYAVLGGAPGNVLLAFGLE